MDTIITIICFISMIMLCIRAWFRLKNKSETFAWVAALMFLLLYHNGKSQSSQNDCKITFKIYLNNKVIETDSVQVGYIYPNNKNTKIAVLNNDFTAYFNTNTKYHLYITHPNYNKVTIKFYTDSTINDSNINIYLTKSKDMYLGELRYNKQLKTTKFYN